MGSVTLYCLPESARYLVLNDLGGGNLVSSSTISFFAPSEKLCLSEKLCDGNLVVDAEAYCRLASVRFGQSSKSAVIVTDSVSLCLDKLRTEKKDRRTGRTVPKLRCGKSSAWRS